MHLAKFHHEDDGLTFGISGSSGVTRFRGVQEDLWVAKVTSLGVGYDLFDTFFLVEPHILSVSNCSFLLLFIDLLAEQI